MSARQPSGQAKRKQRQRLGRPPVDGELRALIRQMSRDNPLLGAPRIHGELLNLGFHVAQSTLAKYMLKRHAPPSQGRKTFMRNHADGIAAIDLFVVSTIGFRLLYGLVIVHLARRMLVWTGVPVNPTAEWMARQFTDAFPWYDAPTDLIRDRDRVSGALFRRRLQVMGIRDCPIAPMSLWQNPYAKRLIGSVQCDCFDHLVVMGAAHLYRILRSYASYYNVARIDRSPNKNCPIHRPIEVIGAVVSVPLLAG